MESATFLNGVMEYWSDGVVEYWKVKEEETVFFSIKTQYSITPALQLARSLQVSLQLP